MPNVRNMDKGSGDAPSDWLHDQKVSMREPSQIHDPRTSARYGVEDEWDEELTDYRVQCLIQIVVAAILLAVLIGLAFNMTRS